MRGLRNEAWVTSVTSEFQVANALVLGESLKHALTSRKLVALVSPEVSLKSRKILRSAFDCLFTLDTEEVKSGGVSPEEFSLLFTFSLQSFQKCVFLASNTFAVKNCDEIFELVEPTLDIKSNAPFSHNLSSFSCLPHGDPTICHVKPNMQIFNSLLETLQNKSGSGVPFGQFLKTWFENQSNDQAQVECIPGKYRHVLQTAGTGDDEILEGDVDFKDMFFVQLEKDVYRLAQNGVNNRALKHWKSLYQESVQYLLEGQLPLSTPLSEKYSKEPIAVVGMSCRFPKSNSVEEFWNILFTGTDATDTPPDFRWLPGQTIRNGSEFRGTNAGFLAVPVDEFDTKFFGISNKDAVFMDPQQRLLHELVWEGLEDAAMDPHKMRGVHGGVFIGTWVTDYRDILSHTGHAEFYRLYMGNSIGATAARISYLLGLTGPSIATESGCSSAMVAVHMAYKSLLSGESNVALACGVNMLLHPFDEDEIPLALSPDGRCKTFSAKADGFGRAEGCAVLVMKRLSDAVKDGDRIWGLLRGSAMTQEGISKSMGTPTVHCEALAMTQALRDADVPPEKVTYVEAHGTGTVVGDPLEVSAIARAYHTKKRKQPLYIGSVKTNVGHTEAVSGIAGLMKVVLSLHHEVIPAHINFDSLNPAIKLEAVPAEIPLKPVEWKRIPGNTRYAGVSAFGIAGTDVHVIVEETPAQFLPLSPTDQSLERPQHFLKVSAKTEEALEVLLEKYRDHVKISPETDSLADMAYTANVGRASFRFRAVVISKDKEDFVEKIETKLMKGETSAETLGKTCFLFTGQGSQYQGMAQNLYETSPVFKFHFDRCETFLRKQYNVSIKPVLWGSSGENIGRTIYSQTSIFAVEYALLKLWNSWGLHPDYVLGHSLGEFCAAVCAGILSLEDALKLVAERSLLIDQLPTGKMLVIKQDKQVVTSLISQFAQGDNSKVLDFAAINSPDQTVVAGDSSLVMEFFAFLQDNGVKSIVLDASHAFHSKHMEPMLDAYRKVAKSVKKPNTKEQLNCEYISGLRGAVVSDAAIEAEYWVEHTRHAVNFLDASKKALELGCQIFIEIGPQPVLSALTTMNCTNSSKLLFLPSLKKKEEDWTTLLHSLAKLYITGVEVDWSGFDRYYSRRKVRLPNYPFMRKKFWPTVTGVSGAKIHPVLGSPIANASASHLYDCVMSLSSSLEYLKDHAIGENVIFPGTGFLEMCLAAGVAATEGYVHSFTRPTRPIKVENLSIEAPLLLEENCSVQVQTVVEMTPNSQTTRDIKISHRVTSETSGNKWLSHVTATYDPLPTPDETSVDAFPLEAVIRNDATSAETAVNEIYDKLSAVGLIFGPVFRSVEKLWKLEEGENGGLVVKIKCPVEDTHLPEYVVHPVILDAMIQSLMMHLILVEKEKNKAPRKKLYVPIKVGKFVWLNNPEEGSYQDIYVRVVPNSRAEHPLDCTAILMDVTGTALAVMSRVEVIDTTVKAVESIIKQQQTTFPDLWEECWKRRVGSLEHRLNFEQCSGSLTYSPEMIEKLKAFTEQLSPRHKEICERLTEFTGLSMLAALYDCGWEPKEGDTFYSDDLFKQLEIQEEHRLYFDFILDVLEEEGMLVKLKEEKASPEARLPNTLWRVATVKHVPGKLQTHLASPMYIDQVTGKLKSSQVLVKVGQNFAEILQGKQNALPILFPEDKANTVSIAAFYEEYGKLIGSEEFGNAVLEHRVQLLKDAMGEQRSVLRILEVGAGTGALTGLLLQVLDNLQVEYEFTYTDVSAGFFPAAEKKFEKYVSHMKFKKLNIEEDPLAQGFIPEYFDYVAASEVIHATKDICESLENVGLLLRPGGRFDLIESTEVNRYITFLVGLLPGYWRFQDLELRPKHCTMSKEKWRGALEKMGYGVDEILSCMMDQNSMICVHKTPEVKIRRSEEQHKVWLVFHQEAHDKVTDFLSRKLSEFNRKTILVYPTIEEKSCTETVYKIKRDSEEDFKWLLAKTSSENVIEGILYCWAMNRDVTEQNELLQPFFYLAKNITSLLENSQQKFLPRVITLTEGIVPIEDNDLSHYHASTIWGFCKSLRNELAELNCRCIDITDGDTEGDLRLQEIFSELFSVEREPQAALHGRTKYVPKLCPYKILPNEQPLKLPSGADRFKLLHPETRAIADLQFGPLDPYVLGDGDVEVEVKFFGLNFRDVLNVIKPTEQFYQKDYDTVGFDFAGEIKRKGKGVTKWQVGDLVFGVNFDGTALPSHVKLPEDYVVPIPDHLPIIQAATLPVVFSTAFHCLVSVAKIKQTDTVLIHTGSGGVGISAIDICKHLGVTNIITTAGSSRKRNFLRNMGIKHVFHSRNTSFADEILRVTNGRGVDVVLNSLTSEGFKQASLRACAQNAWFLEMSKISVWTPEEIKSLRSDINYYIIDYDLSSLTPSDWKERLKTMSNYFLTRQITSPLPIVTFDATDIRQALVYLQKARQIGKVVCVMPKWSQENGKLTPKIPMFNEESSYLITGGLGGIGFLVCQWMLDKGAKNMILLGRSPPSDQVKVQIAKLKGKGYKIEVVNLDIGDKEECGKLFQETIPAMNLPPLKGVMHCAGTLSDGMVANQDWPRLRSVFQSKIDGTLNLHEHTKHINMEHFVLLSSMTGLFGTPGQSNHAAGSCFEDAFAFYRHSVGLPATTVNWGPWGEVGVATEVDFPGIRPISNLQGLATLEHALKSHRAQICALNVDSFVLWSKLVPQLSVYLDERVWKTSTSSMSLNIKSEEFWAEFDSKANFEEKVQVVKHYCTKILSSILRLEEGDKLREDVDLQELGVDSLMYVEIKNALQTLLGDRVTINTSALRECNTINLISEALVKQIEGESAADLEPPTHEQVNEQIRKDSVLPEHICAKPDTPKAVEIRDIKTVLLTGATGTLGMYVLKELLKTEQITKIICLLRPKKDQTVEQRFQKALENRSLTLPQDWKNKVEFIAGNCASPHLGLENALWKDLTGRVDAIFNCAANVNHMEHYRERAPHVEDVRRVNVGGTKNILEFACEARLKHVFHAASLISVATTDGQDGCISERWPEEGDYDGVTTFAYLVSKYVEDMIFKQAVLERGIPCKVYRLPFLSGDSETGQFQLDHSHMMMRYIFIMKNGIMPSNPAPLLMFPVDTGAKIMVRLSLDENVPHDVYNVTHDKPDLDQDFPQVAERFGYAVKIVEFSEFAKRVVEEASSKGGSGSGYHPMLQELYKNEEELMGHYNTAPAFRHWIETEHRDRFFASKKLQKYAPKFHGMLKRSIDYVEKDLTYAKAQGWF